ncbi:hypothetical protein C7B67_27485 [filamentous cyanobacterium Phorm 6]|nr:hypothetical protein C7B67_27485 [filamentous cyanobacterium Phorm 6]
MIEFIRTVVPEYLTAPATLPESRQQFGLLTLANQPVVSSSFGCFFRVLVYLEQFAGARAKNPIYPQIPGFKTQYSPKNRVFGVKGVRFYF